MYDDEIFVGGWFNESSAYILFRCVSETFSIIRQNFIFTIFFLRNSII